MKTIKYIVVTVLLTWSVTTNAQQSYTKAFSTDYSFTNAVGLRIGQTSGLTFKHFFSSGNATEAILSASPYSLGITGLYERYINTEAKGLSWYYGAGGHLGVGLFQTTYYPPYYSEDRYKARYGNYPGVAVGIDGILGLEYKFPKIPIAMSLDVKPFMEVNSTPNIFLAIDPGFGIKYTW